MPAFVLLEHSVRRADHAPPDVHWDLLLDAPEWERLPTWRLARNPLVSAGDIPAERIKDHRRLYLDFEGEVSDGRGLVRRIERGPATIERLTGERLAVVLEGAALRGRFETVRDANGALIWRRRGDAP